MAMRDMLTVRIDEISLRYLEGNLNKLIKNLQVLPELTTRRIASRFKAEVIKRINAGKQPQSMGHSTPESIISRLHYQKVRGSSFTYAGMGRTSAYEVFMYPYTVVPNTGQPTDLIACVELGTHGHWIPVNSKTTGMKWPMNRRIWHPGAKGKYFWRDSVWAMIEESGDEARQLAQRIMNV